jgi:hypothetical protein
MADFRFDYDDFLRHLDGKDVKVVKAAVDSMEDATMDLALIAQNIAPIDKGILRASTLYNVYPKPGGIVGEVSMSAMEDGFNYALWTHEYEYNLGEQSKAAPGYAGYNVGNKYLERPLKGERDKYVKWWREAIAKALD